MIKNIKNPSNANYFGEIVDLNEKEKAIIKEQIKTDETYKRIYIYGCRVKVRAIYNDYDETLVSDSNLAELSFEMVSSTKLDVSNKDMILKQIKKLSCVALNRVYLRVDGMLKNIHIDTLENCFDVRFDETKGLILSFFYIDVDNILQYIFRLYIHDVDFIEILEIYEDFIPLTD